MVLIMSNLRIVHDLSGPVEHVSIKDRIIRCLLRSSSVRRWLENLFSEWVADINVSVLPSTTHLVLLEKRNT